MLLCFLLFAVSMKGFGAPNGPHAQPAYTIAAAGLAIGPYNMVGVSLPSWLTSAELSQLAVSVSRVLPSGLSFGCSAGVDLAFMLQCSIGWMPIRQRLWAGGVLEAGLGYVSEDWFLPVRLEAFVFWPLRVTERLSLGPRLSLAATHTCGPFGCKGTTLALPVGFALSLADT